MQERFAQLYFYKHYRDVRIRYTSTKKVLNTSADNFRDTIEPGIYRNYIGPRDIKGFAHYPYTKQIIYISESHPLFCLPMICDHSAIMQYLEFSKLFNKHRYTFLTPLLANDKFVKFTYTIEEESL